MASDAAIDANAFVDFQLDRAAEHRDDDAWLAAHEADARTRFLWLDEKLRMPVDPATGQLRWLSAEQRARVCPQSPSSLLGVASGQTWFLLRPPASGWPGANDHGTRLMGLRQAGACLDRFHAGLFAYARALAHWQSMTRFCSVCGSPLRLISSGHRAVCTNSHCGHLHFPRTDPAIIVIVEHEGACLLGRQASWGPGRYSTLAGFVEPGEALEAAVCREVAEEAGVEVTACHYHSSQPWPFPGSLMLGFMASASGRPITLRDGELEDARWFTPAEIVTGVRAGRLHLSAPVSVSWHLLADWMRERAGIDLADL